MRPDEQPSFETRAFHTPDLLPPEGRPRTPKKRGIKFLSCFFIILILITLSCTRLIARSNNNFFVGVKNGFLMRQLTHLFSGNSYELGGEKDDRINFLLMGIGGPGHDGPYLTDTIILASLKPSTNEAALLSIPRDLIVPTENGQYIKVNHIYALNQAQGLDHAFAVTKKTIGDAFGIPIHYMGVVDFQGFVSMIDTIGKIKVTVDRDFTDAQFPYGLNSTRMISFKKGTQEMDGTTTLLYARSRHGNNGEGSDFARSKRQQKILLATKEKLSSFNTLFNPRKITTLFSLVNDYTKTDIEPWEVVKLVQMTKDIESSKIYSIAIDDSPGGFLRSGISSVDSAYILQPSSGSYTLLQQLIEGIFSTQRRSQEEAHVVLQNGTTIPNSATSFAAQLERGGIKPLSVGNAKKTSYATTVLYDYSDGAKPETRAYLESLLGTTAETKIPLELLSYTVASDLNLRDEKGEPQPLDFLIILGQDILTSPRAEMIRTLTADELRTVTSTDGTVPADTQDTNFKVVPHL